jgi:hypothetical protein
VVGRKNQEEEERMKKMVTDRRWIVRAIFVGCILSFLSPVLGIPFGWTPVTFTVGVAFGIFIGDELNGN